MNSKSEIVECVLRTYRNLSNLCKDWLVGTKLLMHEDKKVSNSDIRKIIDIGKDTCVLVAP